MGRKVGAHKGDPAAVQREGDRHSALIAADAQHAARYAGRAYLARVLLRVAVKDCTAPVML